MNKIVLHCLLCCLPLFSMAQTINESNENRVVSVIDSTDFSNMILKQTFVVNVSIDSVWNAYTTARGWENWATALAHIDLRINGVIKTNYNKEGSLKDDSTITLHIINYIPYQVLTLQAELNKHFPEFMKEDEKNLYNMIQFEEIDSFKTKVTSYGIGYKNNDKYMSLMSFFIQGNEQSYLNLISYLESGKPSVNY